MTIARALWWTGPGRAELRSESLGDPRRDQCLVRSLFSAVSPGTERVVGRGEVPEESRRDMRCAYMGGSFPFPVKYGYSLVGLVEQGPSEWKGQKVHLMHPHQDRSLVSGEDLHRVPEGVPARRATLSSNLETAVNAIWDSELTVGERVLVVGFGNVGALVTQLLALSPGVEPQVVDTSEAKVARAVEMGFRADHPDHLEGRFDVAIHCSASSSGLQTAIGALDFEGRVVELSWYGDKEVSVRLGGRFHRQRLRILSSQVSSLPARLRGSWDARRRKDLVLSLLENPVFDLHLSGEVGFEESPDAMGALANGSFSDLSLTIAYPA